MSAIDGPFETVGFADLLRVRFKDRTGLNVKNSGAKVPLFFIYLDHTSS